MFDRKIIIAIDGHSSSGKSSFARLLAKKLGYRFLNTGEMYRAVTLHALRNGAFADGKLDHEKLIAMLPEVRMDAPHDELHSIEVSRHVSEVRSIPEVREKLVTLQREAGRQRGIVVEGRDIGTVVFPDAELKIFLTADPAVRAQRRWKDMPEVPLEEIEQNIRARDKADQERPQSPLKKAEDAIVLDNSNMNIDQQITWVLERL